MNDADIAAWSSWSPIALWSSKPKPPVRDLRFGVEEHFGLSAALGGEELATVHHRRSERAVIAPRAQPPK